jgi:hypothetical protein
MRKVWTWLVAIIPMASLHAQELPKKEIDPASLVDEIFATQDLDINYQDLYENYLQLISNPLDLNTVTDEQLRSLYFLRQEEINSILKYRASSGPFLSVNELQTLLDSDVVQKLIPFVTVVDASKSLNKSIIKRIRQEQNNYLMLRWGKTLEPQLGYTEKATAATKYTGSPDNLYARFRTSRAGDFSLGFTVKKDAGEAVTWNPSKKYYAFDYLSFHVQALNKGRIKNLIVGDYQAQFGQGIALGSAFGIGKNGEAVTTMRRPNLGFMPYTSLYEAGYFRGIALSGSITKSLTLHSLVSLRGRDGRVNQDTLSSTSDYLSSFNYSGLHRTAAELANRNAISESNVAGVIQYKKQSLDAGLIFHHTQFSLPLQRNPSLYNQFEFNGDANTNVGGYLNYQVSNYSFFSEFTQTVSHGSALVAGVLASLTPKLDASLVVRRFEKDFYSFYSNAIAENSTPQNESGVYWGWKYSFSKKYSLAGYVDLFTFPWLKYRSYSPSDGSEWLIRFNYKPSKTVSIFLQAREESKQRNTGADTNLFLTAEGVKRNYSINCDYAATAKLSFRTRAQFSTYTLAEQTSRGMVLLQDVAYAVGRFGIAGRCALFDTDDYDNRLYVYERDAWLSFSFPAYYGKGIRNYLMVHYRVSQKADLWLRWSETRYTDRDVIGAGGDTIVGDSRNDVKLQARIRF